MGAKRSRSVPPPDYSSFSPSIIASCPLLGTCAKGVSVAEGTHHIFVTNSRAVSIFTSSCQFITAFRHPGMLAPWGIALYKQDIYVTDFHTLHVFVFREEAGSCRATLFSPGYYIGQPTTMGLAVSEEEIFVTNKCSHCVEVLDSIDFVHTRSISCPSMRLPVGIQLTEGELYVLSENSSPRMHVFSPGGTLLRAMDTRVHGIKESIFSPSFCLDQWGNILVSDMSMRAVMAYSAKGKPFATVSMGDSLIFILGITFVDKNSFIVCVENKIVMYSGNS